MTSIRVDILQETDCVVILQHSELPMDKSVPSQAATVVDISHAPFLTRYRDASLASTIPPFICGECAEQLIAQNNFYIYFDGAHFFNISSPETMGDFVVVIEKLSSYFIQIGSTMDSNSPCESIKYKVILIKYNNDN
jgi:hypothetical protein